ncbi:hypothetical protein Syun_025090 [Stephania yunnanensis]|uniref:J domain-containing protein n=1 Tax=Stephania yunnanensis TaxID=152371 RepID=A0AAP0ETK9_9MAGN
MSRDPRNASPSKTLDPWTSESDSGRGFYNFFNVVFRQWHINGFQSEQRSSVGIRTGFHPSQESNPGEVCNSLISSFGFGWEDWVRMDFPSALRLAEYFSSLGDARRPPHLRHTLFLSSSLHDCGYHVPQNASDFKATEASSTKRSFHATSSCNLAKRDLYEILGVHKDASANVIKNTFLALAKKYHPDTNKNNPAVKRKFQEIRDAYEVFSNLQTLRDSAKRAKYDEESRDATRREYATEETVVFTDAPEEQFSDSFRKIFTEIFESEAEEIAGDVQVDLLLSFDGRGYPTSAKPVMCPTCKGVGTVSGLDIFNVVTVPPFTSTCTICKGVGRIIKESCMACKGSGVVQGVKEVTVAIPAGIESGDTISVRGGGNSGGQRVLPGALFIKLKVAEDPMFHRDGADIYVDSHISFTQAILGGMVDVPTLSGKTQVKIPKGVQPGQLLALSAAMYWLNLQVATTSRPTDSSKFFYRSQFNLVSSPIASEKLVYLIGDLTEFSFLDLGSCFRGWDDFLSGFSAVMEAQEISSSDCDGPYSKHLITLTAGSSLLSPPSPPSSHSQSLLTHLPIAVAPHPPPSHRHSSLPSSHRQLLLSPPSLLSLPHCRPPLEHSHRRRQPVAE